jgi:hypothetical protein
LQEVGQHIRAAHDGCQQIVEIMRNASGKLAHFLQPLRMRLPRQGGVQGPLVQQPQYGPGRPQAGGHQMQPDGARAVVTLQNRVAGQRLAGGDGACQFAGAWLGQ